MIKDKLEKIHFWAYGLGHFINDVTVACWFNFLIFFLKRVAHTPSAAYVLLIGQVTDGISTPLIAYFSDNCKSKLGKRIPWYIVGLVLVSVSFIPLFVVIDTSQTIQFVYYVGSGVLYSVGWAAIQISHMSLVPSLTFDRERRDKLNNIRNAFTYVANLIVLVLGLVLFEVLSDPVLQFLIIAIVAHILGILSSIFFLIFIKEKQLAVDIEKEGIETELTLSLSLIGKDQDTDSFRTKNWFKMPAFYLCGLCYIGVRAYNNILGVFLPFYLVDVLSLGARSQTGISFNLALVPLIIYLFAVITSSHLSWFYRQVGRKKALILGTVVCLLSMVTTLILTVDFNWVIYFVAAFIGCSQALVVSTGVNLISQVVGERSKKGGFVFGVYSFIDKVLVGVVIYLVTNTAAYSTLDPVGADIQFIRWTVAGLPALGCLGGTIAVVFYPIPEYLTKGN